MKPVKILTFSQFVEQLNEKFNQAEMEIANKTSRSAGAVSGKALVPRHVEQEANKNDEILD